jgi:hypothetical protein
MKSITGYLVAAAVAALLGAGCLAAGLLDRDLARAQEVVAAKDYEEPEAAYDTAERYFQYASHLPGVGNGPVNDVRARKAALKYWRREYRELVPQQADPVGSVANDNVDLQLVVAGAVYRNGQAQATDKETLLTAVDAGINAYLTVLKNPDPPEEAAYNYEYLIRLRDTLDKGAKMPVKVEEKSPEGASGAPPAAQDEREFKVYVPLEPDERKNEGEAGKAAPARRKG